MSEPPIYQRIADDLRNAIDSGEFAAGSRLPGVLVLATRFGVSPNTIRQGLNVLARQGVVRTQPGVGTFVSSKLDPVGILLSQPAATELPDRDAHARDLLDTEIRSNFHSLVIKVEPAAAFVAERLEISAGAAVLVRSWVLELDDFPWAIQRSYFPHDLVEGTEIVDARNIDRGTISVLAGHGYTQTHCQDLITAAMPSHEERRMLELDEGIPVIILDRTSYGAERPIRLNRTLYRADRQRLIYNVPEQGGWG